MIDLRIYRAGLLPAIVAVVVLMFAVEPIPEPLRAPATTITEFDEGRAIASSRRIAEIAPEREPGSPGDAAAADLVAKRFGAMDTGELIDQRFDGRFDGEDVELRNVALALPGNSPRTVVVIAHRDASSAAAAEASAVATGVLIELAEELGSTRHEKTLLFASTDAGSDGARGARELAESYAERESIDAVLVLSSHGPAGEGAQIRAWSTGAQSSSAQLVESADAALREAGGGSARGDGFVDGLLRLAIPSGLGEQAALLADGYDAVGLVGPGGSPAADAPGTDAVDRGRLAVFGGAALTLIHALDAADQPLVDGPADQLRLAGNLIGGWALAVLGLALLLPALISSVDALARAGRRGEAVLRGLCWTGLWATPFLAALLLAHLLALVGLAPDPDFPFEAERFQLGAGAVAIVTALTVVLGASLIAVRRLSEPARVSPQTLAASVGTIAGLAVLATWLLNPYLALLLVPLSHVWILAARSEPVRTPALALAVGLALAPAAAAVVALAGRLGGGPDGLWRLLLMVTGGQIDFAVASLGCVAAGTVVGLLALGRAPSRRAAPPLPDDGHSGDSAPIVHGPPGSPPPPAADPRGAWRPPRARQSAAVPPSRRTFRRQEEARSLTQSAPLTDQGTGPGGRDPRRQ